MNFFMSNMLKYAVIVLKREKCSLTPISWNSKMASLASLSSKLIRGDLEDIQFGLLFTGELTKNGS